MRALLRQLINVNRACRYIKITCVNYLTRPSFRVQNIYIWIRTMLFNNMKNQILFGFILLFFVQLSKADCERKTIVFKVKSQYRQSCFVDKIEVRELQELLEPLGIIELKKVFPHHQFDLDAQKRNPQLVDLTLIYQLKYASNISELVLSKKMASLGCIVYAEPKYFYQPMYIPNDTDFTSQYHHNNLHTIEAWNIQQGDTNVVIGITDTGFDTTHLDLKSNVKYNYADPVNGVDDDNDGYLDNFYGWDFGNNDNNPQQDGCAVCGHGVHVSGISSATTDNTTGIAGTGFKCKYLAVKNMNNSEQLANSYEAIVYAADHQATVVNCSWGGESGGQYGQDAVNYATYNRDCLVLAAAGNNFSNTPFYPAAYDNVFSIAATNSSDAKWSNSNYGYFIDACAPGQDIYSCWPGNNYLTSSGTSMAAPAAAGCVAIVASQFPNYNALQLAERLKNTCDVIDTLPSNNQYKNQLGFGRINLYRALTDIEKSAVVVTAKEITDGNDAAIIPGDTVSVKCRFTNYLAPTSNLVATIKSENIYTQILDSTVMLGALGTLVDSSNYLHPFRILINGNCPTNYEALFSITLQDGSNIRKEYFSIRVNVDYINLLENDLGITITSKGLIGYNESGPSEGIGVTYNSPYTMLYEGGFMIGDSATRVSDNLRSTAGGHDVDFVPLIKVSQIPSAAADALLDAVFTDIGAGANKLGVRIHQQTYAWSSTGNTNFVILKYLITNTNAFDLDNVYAGIFADWDIMNYSKNRTKLNISNKLSMTYTTEVNPSYAAIKLLSPTPFIHYAIDNINNGAGGANLTDSYTSAEKYLTLSTNRDSAGFQTAQGNDVIDMVSTGPMNVYAGDSIEIAFAIIGGGTVQEILAVAQSAQLKYDGIITDSFAYRSNKDISVYPNPCSTCVLMMKSLNALSDYHVNVYDLCGNKVFEKRITKHREPLQLGGFAKGLYLVQVVENNQSIYHSKIFIQD